MRINTLILIIILISGKAFCQTDSVSKAIQDFCAAGIQEIIFSKGQQSCFSSFHDEAVYQRKQEEFETTGVKRQGSKHPLLLLDVPESIAKNTIDDFIKILPTVYKKQATLQELAFTQQELNKCKKDIKRYQKALKDKGTVDDDQFAFTFHINNINFTKLLAIVDSLPAMNALVPGIYSTDTADVIVCCSTFWSKITLVNNKNEKLKITSGYAGPAAQYPVWNLEINSIRLSSNAVEINHFINDSYPAFASSGDRISTLYQLVKDSYLKKL